MKRAFFKLQPVSTAALLAAAGLAVSGVTAAKAADLGGDCCADLEERVAELEATTARKGNRKVSLEVSGHINEAVIYWNDGDESNVYQVGNDQSRTRFRFKGEAKIAGDWKAGYLLEFGVRSANSKRFTQNDDEGGLTGTNNIDLRHSAWYIGSKTYGNLWVGQTGTATEDITEINLAQTKEWAKNASDVEDTGLGLFLRRKGVNGNVGLSGLQWYRLIKDSGDQPGEGDRQNTVRYDSPTFAGFYISAAWGEDDFWDVALRYHGEIAGFKLAGGVGYGETTDGVTSGNSVGVSCLQTNANLSGGDAACQQWGGSVSIMHVGSGLFVNFSGGQFFDDRINDATSGTSFFGTGASDESRYWAVQAGIEQKFTPLGKTTIYGEYYDFQGGANAHRTVAGTDILLAGTGFGTSRIFDSDVEMYGAGIGQGIDSAAMHLYLFWRHYEADVTLMRGTSGLGPTVKPDLEDLDIVMGGAKIKF